MEHKERQEMMLIQDLSMDLIEQAVQAEIIDMQAKSLSTEVTNEDEAKQAVSMALQARKCKNQIEESRDELIRPVLDYQRAVNKVVKDLKCKLESIEERLHKKVSDWMIEENKENIFYSTEQIEVEDGKIYKTKSWEFQIIDWQSIPIDYLKPDETLIKDAIKRGIRKIPGVEIFEKEDFKMRVNNKC